MINQTVVFSPSIIKSNITYAMALRNSNHNTANNKLQSLIQNMKVIKTKPDSPCTGNFFGEDFSSKEPINGICANNSEMTSTKTKELNIEELPQEARKCHICPDMKDTNLLSVPLLCDAGCMCVFCRHKIG